MLLVILVLIGGILGIGGALNIYYEIKHDKERKERDARAARERATRKMFL